LSLFYCPGLFYSLASLFLFILGPILDIKLRRWEVCFGKSELIGNGQKKIESGKSLLSKRLN
jgi:hypothetical protein